MVGAVVPDDRTAAVLGPIAFALMSLFGGFFLNIDSLPWYVAWLQYTSLFRFSFQASSPCPRVCRHDFAAVANDRAFSPGSDAERVPWTEGFPRPSPLPLATLAALVLPPARPFASGANGS
jgi:hypothetical protein